MTDVDYQGETYYTIRNLSLYECQGWCREEVECQAASFSFVANGLGQQETVCLLQNGTQANNPTSKPIRARNQYYMVKMSIRSGELQKNIISCILNFMKSTDQFNWHFLVHSANLWYCWLFGAQKVNCDFSKEIPNVWSIKIRTTHNLSLWLYEYFWIILLFM